MVRLRTSILDPEIPIDYTPAVYPPKLVYHDVPRVST